MRNLGLNLFDEFFWLKTAVLIALKLIEFKIMKKTKILFFFYRKQVSIWLRLSSQACGGNGRRRKLPLDGAAYL